GQQDRAGGPVDTHASSPSPVLHRIIPEPDKPEFRTSVNTTNRTSASPTIEKAAIASLRTQGSEWATRTASEGSSPLGDRGPEGPRTRRIFSWMAVTRDCKSPAPPAAYLPRNPSKIHRPYTSRTSQTSAESDRDNVLCSS